ncbi:MAG: hypothetical protein EOO52_12740 [Gammaproteobacteria bacterium]|nr:MAG: hypothetical protein EOO52_12740 [Gammaproteobacteria bacterium]
MIYSDVIQKTIEWHRWRKTGVGASDAATLLGLNPEKGEWTLWAEKTMRGVVENLERNPLVRKGNLLEPRARTCAEMALQEPMLVAVCAISSENQFAIASLDGLTLKGRPVELKVPAQSTYAEICDLGVSSKAYVRYFPQIQHQLLVTGADYGWLFFYNPDDTGDYREFQIFRNEKMISELSSKILQFMSAVNSGVAPRKDPAKDIFFPTADEDIRAWKFHAAGYAMIEKLIAEKSKEIEILKESALIHQNNFTRIMGSYLWADYAGINVTKVTRKGNVNYKKILADKSISLTENVLDSYRNEAISYYKFACDENVMPKNIIDVDVATSLVGFEKMRISKMF